MPLYLDSASVADARASAALRFVTGITTNPTLLARALAGAAAASAASAAAAGSGASARSADDAIAELCDVHPGMVFYQPVAATPAEQEVEARRVAAVRPGRVGLKIASTPSGFAVARRLADDGFVVAMTAIFDAAQAWLACQAGARLVIPYVNRSTRLLGDGARVVRAMRDVIDASGAPTEILAASVKSPAEAVAAVLSGAHSLTLPLAVIEALGRHELSDAAVAEFAEAWRAV